MSVRRPVPRIRGTARSVLSLLLTVALVATAWIPPVFAVEPRGYLEGSVEVAEPTDPVVGVRVTLYATDGSRTPLYETQVMEGGGYEFRDGVAPGSYFVGFKDPNGVYYDAYYQDGPGTVPSIDEATPVDVEATAGWEDRVSLQSKRLNHGGRILGAVTVPVGVDVTDVWVEVKGSWTEYYARSLADGSFTVNGIFPGSYTIGFWSEDDVVTRELYNDKPWNWDHIGADSVQVDADQQVSLLPVALSRSGSISGTIRTDVVAADLSEVLVHAYRLQTDEMSGDEFWGWTTEVFAGRDGSYTIGGLEAGEYRLKFIDQGGALAFAYHGGGTMVEDATTVNLDAEQSYVIDQPQDLVAGAVISGTVSAEDGGDVTPVEIQASVRSTTQEWSWESIEARAEVQPDGSYVLRGLAPGDYQLRFSDSREMMDPDNARYAQLWYESSNSWFDADTIPVPQVGAHVPGIDVTMRLGFSISGTVQAPPGVDFSFCQVTAWPVQEDGRLAGGTSGFAPLDPETGNFVLRGLPAGRYVLGVDSSRNEFGAEYWEDEIFAEDGTVIELNADTVLERPIVVGLPGDISGFVRNERGQGIGGAYVVALAYSPTLGAWWPASWWAETAPDGSYNIRGLAGGQYLIYAEHGEGLFEPRYWTPTDSVALQRDAAQLEVVPGLEFTAKNFVLPAVPPVQTVAGDTLYDTAAEIATTAYPEGADTVILATGTHWSDALGGSALSGVLDAPILLVDQAQSVAGLPDSVEDALDALAPSDVVVLGGRYAVPPALEADLDRLGYDVERIWGETLYDTADLVAARVIDELGESWDGTAVFATGAHFSDALAVSPITTSRAWPVFLVDPTKGGALTPGAAAAAARITDAVVIGGRYAVPEAISSRLTADPAPERIAGELWTDTAALIAEWGVESCGMSFRRLAVATGDSPYDALAGGALQSRRGSVMLLTGSASLSPAAERVISENAEDIVSVTYLGGIYAVTQPVRDRVGQLLAG